MVGIAVCGAGNWGRNLVRQFATAPGARLIRVADADPEVRARVSTAHPDVQVDEGLAPALADPAVHAVVIATDAPSHFHLAKRSLEAGKHVFVEKPITLEIADAEVLTAMADAKNLRLMVGHLLIHHPAVTHIKTMIDAGDIDPIYAYFQRLNLGVIRETENAWWSLAPHDVAMACYFFDAEPVTVSATGHASIRPGVEDVVFASLTFADGRMAHIHVSWLDPHKVRKATLVGAKKMVVFDDMEPAEKIRVYDKGADVKPGMTGYAESITLRTGDIHIPHIRHAEPLSLECRRFIDAIRADAPVITDGRDGQRVVRVLTAGSTSIHAGGAPIDVRSGHPIALA